MSDNTILKIILFGRAVTGKTSFFNRVIMGTYDKELMDPTIEDNAQKMIVVDGEAITVQITDTGGVEEYSSMRRQFAVEGEAFLLHFNVNNRKTLEDLDPFVRVIESVKERVLRDVPVIVVGACADDDFGGEREVSFEEAEAFASSLGTTYVEISAKEDRNCSLLLEEIVRLSRLKNLGDERSPDQLKKEKEQLSQQVWDLANSNQLEQLESMKNIVSVVHLNSVSSSKTKERVVVEEYNSKERSTPFFLATLNKNIEMMEWLVSKGADPNISNGFGFTPLMSATIGGNKEIVKTLLKNNTNPIITKDEMVATEYANQGDFVMILRLLEEYERNWEALKNDEPPEYPFHSHIKWVDDTWETICSEMSEDEKFWAEVNRKDIIEAKKLLFEHSDIDINWKHPNKSFRSCMIVAAERNDAEMIKFLVSQGGDLNGTSEEGLTPLICAARNGNKASLASLMFYNADPHCFDRWGQTAKKWAENMGDEEIVFILGDFEEVYNSIKDEPDEIRREWCDSTLNFRNERNSSFLSRFKKSSKPSLTSIRSKHLQDEEKTSSSNENDRGSNGFFNNSHSKNKGNTFSSFFGGGSTQSSNTNFDQEIPLDLISLTQQVRELRSQYFSQQNQLSAHTQALNQLVSGEIQIPSLIWFVPRKKSSWLKIMRNPTSWFEDEVMLVFLCGYDHCVVECGPEGEGYLIRNPKEWVRKWAPAIQASLWLLKGLSIAGKFIGIPIPTIADLGGNDVVFKSEILITGMIESLLEFGNDVEGTLDSYLEGNKPEQQEEKRRVTKEAYQSLYEFIHGEDPTLSHVGLVRTMSEESGNVEWVLEENEEKWKEREREAITQSMSKSQVSSFCEGEDNTVSRYSVQIRTLKEENTSQQKMFQDQQALILKQQEDMGKMMEMMKKLEEATSSPQPPSQNKEMDGMSQIDPDQAFSEERGKELDQVKVRQGNMTSQVTHHEEQIQMLSEEILKLKSDK